MYLNAEIEISDIQRKMFKGTQLSTLHFMNFLS